VSSNFVTLLGTPPLVGRTLTQDDDAARDGFVVLISHQLWRGRFGGDLRIIGRRIVVDGTSRTVVGVMPPEFTFPAVETALWIPVPIDARDRIALWSTSRRMIGRLRPGASLNDAHDEIRALAPSMRDLFPWSMPAEYGSTAAAQPLHDALVGDVRAMLWLMLAAVSVVLLIACANVSHLLVARTRARRGELAIRSSLGASRGRLLRHVFTEGALLVSAGVWLGLPLGLAGTRALATWLPADMPRPVTAVLDVRLLAFGGAAVAAVVMLVALVPAVRASRLDLAPQLAESGRAESGRDSRWTSNVLVAAQVALAIVLVVTASLLVRSLRNLAAVSPGFAAEQLLSARVSPPSFRFGAEASRRDLYQRVLDRAAALPGVTRAALADTLPFAGEAFGSVFAIEGRPDPAKTGEWPLADIAASVSPGFFESLGIRLTEGRGFADEDSLTAMRVVVISESLARRYWPGESALGRRVTFPGDPAGLRTIVGVVSDVKWERITDEAPTALYLPVAQRTPDAMRIIVRVSGDSAVAVAHLRSIVRSIDPDTPVDQIRPLGDFLAASVQQPRFAATLLSVLAIAGLVLGAIGIFATIADHVARRRREIGIRVALGARPTDVIRTVAGGTLLVVACGAAIGVAAALAVSRLFEAMLFGVTATDTVSFALSALVLALTAAAAAYLPARRAASIEPLVALR
jgi:predicted permease